jgi:hypothetical protein
MRSCLVLACVTALAVGACGGGTAASSDAGTAPGTGDDGGGGGGDAAGSSADAFVAVSLGAGPSSPAPSCNVTAGANALAIGSASTPGFPNTIHDGGVAPSGSPVHVSCSVTPAGSGFDVALAATLEGLAGGSLTITSPPGAGAVTASGANGITATLQTASLGTYREADCTIVFTYEGAPVPDSPAVAAGRIWGHLSCPHAVLGGVTTTAPDGGVEQVACDSEADFLFEGCAQ